jgi:hypothetical protein
VNKDDNGSTFFYGSLEREYGFRYKERIKILKRVSRDAGKMTKTMDF